VVYVECDLRRQRVRKLLADAPSLGLTDVLEGVKSAGDVILALDRPQHLSLLLAGRSPSNPVELLGGPAMGDLLAWLRERFDLIVLDTPPALNFADAGRLGVHMDGVVLVVRVGRTPREALAKTHRLLSPYGILGVVVNDLDLGPGAGYGYYYRGYYGHPAPEDEE
jgi:Mrp family chromosome partitioning ATPase